MDRDSGGCSQFQYLPSGISVRTDQVSPSPGIRSDQETLCSLSTPESCKPFVYEAVEGVSLSTKLVISVNLCLTLWEYCPFTPARGSGSDF